MNSLPTEIVSHVESFLPSYQFLSKNAVGKVCKKWHKAQNLHEAQKVPKTKNAIVASCKTPEDALFIMQDHELFNSLSYQQQLLVIGAHPQMAIGLLDSHTLESGDFCYIAAKHLEVAEYVLSIKELREKLNQSDLVKLGMIHGDVAYYMLSQEDLMAKLSRLDAGNIIASHLTVAKGIIKSGKSLNLLHSICLAKLISSDFDIAEQILNEPKLRHQLKDDALSAFGKYPALAERVLADAQLRIRLKSDYLGWMGRNNKVIAERILAEPDLREKIKSNFFALSLLAASDLGVALRILNDKEFELSSFLLASIARYHPQVAEMLLNTPHLLAKILKDEYSKPLHYLACTPALLNRMLNAPSLRTKLAVSQVIYLINDKQAFKRILTEDDLSAQLESEHLSRLANCKANVEIILNKGELVAKLDGQDLSSMAVEHHYAAMRIVNTPSLLKLLNSEQLCFMGLRNSLISTIILEKAALGEVSLTAAAKEKLTKRSNMIELMYGVYYDFNNTNMAKP